LNRLNCRLHFYAFSEPIDSSNVHPVFWQRLAAVIEKNFRKYDGFVVLHGTDTMAYTASALSFMFENLSKPVILTGSQVPLGTIRTDARRNLITAVEIAAATRAVPEVCIYFNNFFIPRQPRRKIYFVEVRRFPVAQLPAAGGSRRADRISS
jgi:L-asparaginase